MKNTSSWKSEFEKDRHGNVVFPLIHRRMFSFYRAAITRYARGRLADVGCGTVPYYELYRDLVAENVCIDWEHSPFDKSFLDVEVDLNVPNLVLQSSSFDTVLCTEVLEHVYNPHVLFSELARILACGGHLILGAPFLYWVHDEKHDYFRFTDRMLRKYCSLNGLEVVQISAYGGLPEVLFLLVESGYNYLNLPFKRSFGWWWTLCGRLLAHAGFVKRMSARSGTTFALGYLLVAKKKR